MKKFFAIAFIVLSLPGMNLGYSSTSTDRRIKIDLTAEEKNTILGEMRKLLMGVQGIIKAVSDEDFKQVAIHARSNGMIMAKETGHHPGLVKKLPEQFKKLGFGTHKSFDELADKALGMSGPEILKTTATIMNNCVACHATYRITD